MRDSTPNEVVSVHENISLHSNGVFRIANLVEMHLVCPEENFRERTILKTDGQRVQNAHPVQHVGRGRIHFDTPPKKFFRTK
jgi:hypothetical protein